MNKNDYAALMEAYKMYDELMNKHVTELGKIADDLKEKLKEAYFKIYPKEPKFSGSRYGDNAWMHYSDYVNIELDNNQIEARFWAENGQDRDDELHTIIITSDMLTIEGRKNYVDSWTDLELVKISEQNQKKEQDRTKEIKKLEEQLAKLRGVSNEPTY